jgi:hypothetical protein
LAQLQAMLMMMSRPASERGGTGDRAFLAFKVLRFISGAGHVYATLRGAGQRRVTLDGQRLDPQDPDARLYATFFCRNCGQEHHPVVFVKDGGVTRILPRPIDETPLEDTSRASLIPTSWSCSNCGTTALPLSAEPQPLRQSRTLRLQFGVRVKRCLVRRAVHSVLVTRPSAAEAMACSRFPGPSRARSSKRS